MKRDTKIKTATGILTIVDLGAIAYLLYDFEQKNCTSGPDAYGLAAFAATSGFCIALVKRAKYSINLNFKVGLSVTSILGFVSGVVASGMSIDNIYNACGGLSQVPQLAGLTASSLIGGGLLGKFTLFQTNSQPANVQGNLPPQQPQTQEGYQPLGAGNV